MRGIYGFFPSYFFFFFDIIVKIMWPLCDQTKWAIWLCIFSKLIKLCHTIQTSTSNHTMRQLCENIDFIFCHMICNPY